MWKISVFGVFNKNIKYSTELVKKPTIHDLLFFIALYSPKNDKHPLKWEISTTADILL